MHPSMTAEQRLEAAAAVRVEQERIALLLREAQAVGMTHAEKALRLERAAASLRA